MSTTSRVDNTNVINLIKSMPKAELHLHIEGTLEPEMMMALATKHQIKLPYHDLKEVHDAYNFEDLQSFLDLYYLGASVLIDEDDFYQLMWAYLKRCHSEHIVHTEIMFDPQTHTDRGIAFSTMFNGYLRALQQAQAEWGQSWKLIMCFLRHLSEASGFEVLEAAAPFKQHITAVGLDSGELGNPPEKFSALFNEAKQQGYRLVAHAGEEGPPSYIWTCLDMLDVSRIDHGVRSLEDAALVKKLIQSQTPLTVCPLSNIRLCVYEQMENHPILSMLDDGLMVSVNSDDPPYFGGYLNDNFIAIAEHLDMTVAQCKQLAKNSFISSFISTVERDNFIAQLEQAYLPYEPID